MYLMNYESSTDSFGSDHRPVFAQFYIDYAKAEEPGNACQLDLAQGSANQKLMESCSSCSIF